MTVAVARMRGQRALAGLGVSFAVIATFMLPALLAGQNALAVGLVGAVVILCVVPYLAHRLNPPNLDRTTVLNDVTITQSSAVGERREADPTATSRELFTRAMRIGRDHIASTIYTIAFAYAGASLPVLLLVEIY